MEQKRTLWIIAAVGVFLLVVLGAAVILYSPTLRGQQDVANASSSYSDKTTSSNGWISLAPASAQIDEEKLPDSAESAEESNDAENSYSDENSKNVEDMTIYANNATIYSNSTENKETQQTPVTNIYNTTTIDLNPSAKTDSTEKNAKPAESVKETEKTLKKENSPVVAKKSAQKTDIKESSKKIENSVAKATGKSQKPQANTSKKEQKTVFWIQVTALTSRKSADEAREILEKNQIAADVFTYKNNKNKLFYRVRVGPYTTKSEAEYWRSKISAIENFKNCEAYVTSTSVESL